jgi:predicted ATPase/class 3 adenylate cyclase/Tfp pilus assembly protein PilF
MPADASSSLSIRLFGPFEARLPDGSLLPLRSRKEQWLLALLALQHSRPRERAWLAGTLWPDSSPTQSLANLRNCLTGLRRALGPEGHRLGSPTPRTLVLDLTGTEVDLLAFDAAIARGDEPSLAVAVGLHQGALLEECSEAWALPERERREQAFLQALEQLAACAVNRSARGEAEGYLRRAIEVDPLRESAYRALMRLLAEAGRYAAVLQVYRELRLGLHQELNAEPDPETTALFRQLRAEAREQSAGRSQVAARANRTRVISPPMSEPSLSSSRIQKPELRAPSAPQGTLTFLFTDVEGSTRLWEGHPETMRAALARHDALLHRSLEAHGGFIFKTVGDQFCAAFAAAPDAMAAALAAQRLLQAQEWRDLGALPVRMALHTGTAEERGGDYFGPALNRIARLLEAGHGGRILLSQATVELVRDQLPEGADLRDLGLHRLRDLTRPEQIFQLVAPGLPASFPPLRSLEAFRHNLPAQLTSFIGREREIEEVKRLLAGSRLLTLTGAGGCGKTRLALQVAADRVEAYRDGVWFVPLAALTDPALVPQTMATALGVREDPGRRLTATLEEYLRGREALLLMDNCEHLLTAAAELTEELLQACPRLQILATSREGLGLLGEQTYRIPPLSLPTAGRESPETLMEYEAVQLFAERARLSQPAFTVTEGNAAAVAEVCRRLDGIPLAIELAAARLKALPVEQIAARLEDRFRLLTGGSRTALPRQQTLRALIDWSYDLLSGPERAVLRRLSVFAGGWTLEAAEAIVAGDEIEVQEVLDLLRQLVERSLVVYESREGMDRYRLLETIRQYARDRLLEAAECEAVGARHRDWFVALTERAEPRLRYGAEQAAWLDRLEREHDNLRAALEWCQATEGGEEAGLRLVGALTDFWRKRGHLSEGWQCIANALAAGRTASVVARGKALAGAMLIARVQYEHGARFDDAREALAAEGLALGRETGDRWLMAHSLLGMGWAAWYWGDSGQTEALYEEGLALAREVGDKWLIALLLQNLGMVIAVRGDDELARTLHQEALDLNEELEDTWQIAVQQMHLGWLAQRQRNYDQARALFSEAMVVWRGIGDRRHFVLALNSLAYLALIQKEYETAQSRYEEALQIARELDEPIRIVEALLGLSGVARGHGEHEKARALLDEARSVDPGDDDLCAGQGHLLLEMGDYAAARSRFEEGLALRRKIKAPWAVPWALVEVGHVAWLQGEPLVTQTHAVEALELFQEREDQKGILAALESLAVAAFSQGRKERAARLLAAAEAQREGLGLPGPHWWRRPRERIGEAVREASLQQEFAAAWAAGRALSLDEAIACALQDLSGV